MQLASVGMCVMWRIDPTTRILPLYSFFSSFLIGAKHRTLTWEPQPLPQISLAFVRLTIILFGDKTVNPLAKLKAKQTLPILS